jgi:DNA-binding NarL/FixJ family response regulator
MSLTTGPQEFVLDAAVGRADDSTAIRVAIHSDQELIRAGLTTLLAHAPQRTDVLEPSDTDAHHDVVVFDLVSATGPARAHALRQLRQLVQADRSVVAVTRESCQDLAARVKDLGCADVVTLNVSAAELLDVVQSAASRPPSSNGNGAAECRLTRRETQIVERVARGMSNSEIAQELFLSVNSVKTYIRTAYKKMGVTTRSQAVLWAVRRGLGQETSGASADGAAER